MSQYVVCSECGHEFLIEICEEEYDPESCPLCNKKIVELFVPLDGARVVAKAEE